jgi:hypothetical protein
MVEDYLEQYVLSSQARQIAGHILAAYLEQTFEGVDGLATSKVSVTDYDRPRAPLSVCGQVCCVTAQFFLKPRPRKKTFSPGLDIL